ncbi:MAG TPA: rhodanese-like domain-containing protein, partial [Candidatus Polarisedimenticolia bacterium]|nr:rhodanese-like domain-containing protein [Candidatus Polarisedimenticolia bacterium]
AHVPKSFMDLVNEARSRIREIDVASAAAAIEAGQATVVDVREPEEYRQGRIEGSINIPRGIAEMGVPQMIPDPRTRIICLCAGGNRSALVADSLRQMGYENIESLVGGFQGWVRSGLKVVR